MQFSEIKLQIAENVGYDDGADGILASKDLTENMIGRFVNNRYQRLLAKLAGHFPKDYRHRTAPATFYKTSGTISSQTTTTLVATSGIFDNAMIGDTIYNSTDSASAVIAEYTSSTTVVLTTSVDWTDGATIYVLGTEFAIGGDAASDLRYVTGVDVKYSSTDDWIPCTRKANKETAIQNGFELYTSSNPIWYPTNVKVSGIHRKAIGILPEPTTALSNALRITYIEMPPILSASSSEPELPLGSHDVLVIGGTIDALKKLRRNDEAQQLYQDWTIGVRDMIGDYARSTVGAASGRVRAHRDYDMRMRNR